MIEFAYWVTNPLYITMKRHRALASDAWRVSWVVDG